jgi:hypothetical protein
MTIYLSSVRSYSGTWLARPPSPSAWVRGWKNGWDQPTNTAARTGHDFGHNAFLVLIVFAVIVFFFARMARRRGSAKS